jgi:hypothetical protein
MSAALVTNADRLAAMVSSAFGWELAPLLAAKRHGESGRRVLWRFDPFSWLLRATVSLPAEHGGEVLADALAADGWEVAPDNHGISLRCDRIETDPRKLGELFAPVASMRSQAAVDHAAAPWSSALPVFWPAAAEKLATACEWVATAALASLFEETPRARSRRVETVDTTVLREMADELCSSAWPALGSAAFVQDGGAVSLAYARPVESDRLRLWVRPWACEDALASLPSGGVGVFCGPWVLWAHADRLRAPSVAGGREARALGMLEDVIFGEGPAHGCEPHPVWRALEVLRKERLAVRQWLAAACEGAVSPWPQDGAPAERVTQRLCTAGLLRWVPRSWGGKPEGGESMLLGSALAVEALGAL